PEHDDPPEPRRERGRRGARDHASERVPDDREGPLDARREAEEALDDPGEGLRRHGVAEEVGLVTRARETQPQQDERGARAKHAVDEDELHAAMVTNCRSVLSGNETGRPKAPRSADSRS